jgi:hypothetical protein
MSGGPDLNRRPLRPERICDPAIRCFVAYRARVGVRWHLFCVSYGGKMAATCGVADPPCARSSLSTGTQASPGPRARHRRFSSSNRVIEPGDLWSVPEFGRNRVAVHGERLHVIGVEVQGVGRAVVSLHDGEIPGVDAARVCRGAVRWPGPLRSQRRAKPALVCCEPGRFTRSANPTSTTRSRSSSSTRCTSCGSGSCSTGRSTSSGASKRATPHT